MLIAQMELTLCAPWVHSLKEKRMELKSLLAKLRNRFQVAVAETGMQDVHQILQIGVAAIVPDSAQGDSVLDHILGYVEQNTEAEITQIDRRID